MQGRPSHDDQPAETNCEQNEQRAPKRCNSEQWTTDDESENATGPRKLFNGAPPRRAIAGEVHEARHREQRRKPADDEVRRQQVGASGPANDGESGGKDCKWRQITENAHDPTKAFIERSTQEARSTGKDA